MATEAAVDTTPTAAAESALDGWGPYKFGMTREAAQAIPGIAWQYHPAIELAKFHQTLNAMLLAQNANADESGFAFSMVGLVFSSDDKLITVVLNQNLSPDQCESTYKTILRNEEAKYGPFAPLEQRLPNPIGVSSSVENLPDGTSRYKAMNVPAAGIGPIYSADTWRSFDNGTIRARMVGNSGGSLQVCHVSLEFHSTAR